MPATACADVFQLPAVSAKNLMAGDMPRQLPPLLHTQYLMQKSWLKQTSTEAVSGSSALHTLAQLSLDASR